jgi:hypothetical protein
MPSNSLASVPESIKARQLYPENFHGEEGAYVDLEHGRVRYWFKGPAEGRRVRQPPVPSLFLMGRFTRLDRLFSFPVSLHLLSSGLR